MISIRIDVTKIDKSRLYKGQKGTYLDCVMIETPNSEYGDYMIVESTTRDEREQGIKGTILGNGKRIIQSSETRPKDKPQDNFAETEDDLPF